MPYLQSLPALPRAGTPMPVLSVYARLQPAVDGEAGQPVPGVRVFSAWQDLWGRLQETKK